MDAERFGHPAFDLQLILRKATIILLVPRGAKGADRHSGALGERTASPQAIGTGADRLIMAATEGSERYRGEEALPANDVC